MADAVERAAAAGIHPIVLGSPFAIGDCNVYLLDDEPLTLVDCGTNWGRSLDDLARGLEPFGHRVDDLELILLTHPHADHLGLVDVLARRSGAAVASIEQARPYVEDFAGETEADNRYLEALMVSHGFPSTTAAALRLAADSLIAFGASTPVTRPLTDGGRLELAHRVLEVAFRPGHSPSDAIFIDSQRGMAFVGDHVLADSSSNPLMTRPLGSALDDTGARPRPRPLVTFIESLQATRSLDADLLLGGHGPVITNPTEVIDSRLSAHERRAGRMLAVVRERPATAFEIAQSLWGEAAIREGYLAFSSVLGHMDLLLDSGAVREQVRGGVTRFAYAA